MTIKLIDPTLGAAEVSQDFGPSDIDYSQWNLVGHNGIDYGCVVGTAIYAAADGTINKIAYEDGGYGNYIKIKHDWGVSIYAHLSGVVVTAGQNVTAGTIIARSGNTGFCTGPHLHFEIRPSTEPTTNGYGGAVDPTPYFESSASEDTTETPATDTTEDTGEKTTKKATVVWGSLNVRPETNTKTPAVAVLYAGLPVEYEAILEIKGDDGKIQKWLKCNLWGQTVLIAAYYGDTWSVNLI
ncbi:MAG: M23 family metallopeptidase [Methanoregula sp.]|jgi:murein DD-endopeptidase MepM/ murein hydrolase activator NlpD|nr:M23 family metallopeptidase [Methanoregula sp.]